jgi:hypothetical protein
MNVNTGKKQSFVEMESEDNYVATPRQLVQATAEILALSEATVIVHDRNLATVPTPLRSVAGRGRAAARVTAGDAANLLIAVAASESVKDSAKTVFAYRDLLGESAVNSGIQRYDELPANHTLGQALAALIEAAAAKEITLSRKLNLKVTFFGPRAKAKIEWEINGASSWTGYEPPSKWPAKTKLIPVGDLERMTTITENTIFRLGAAVGDSR